MIELYVKIIARLIFIKLHTIYGFPEEPNLMRLAYGEAWKLLDWKKSAPKWKQTIFCVKHCAPVCQEWGDGEPCFIACISPLTLCVLGQPFIQAYHTPTAHNRWLPVPPHLHGTLASTAQSTHCEPWKTHDKVIALAVQAHQNGLRSISKGVPKSITSYAC